MNTGNTHTHSLPVYVCVAAKAKWDVLTFYDFHCKALIWLSVCVCMEKQQIENKKINRKAKPSLSSSAE